ncbi:hypothetical protein DPMN_188650 [Dreissena polymorpha]|uniref:Uncharacterized protein n=1 Tax=Dreissena polymorpha TaxID=45954 RepID=A0A9D4DS07_DREPO|nr:hypothetical protein DPMN_188650 [Dreissena polymorpha]
MVFPRSGLTFRLPVLDEQTTAKTTETSPTRLDWLTHPCSVSEEYMRKISCCLGLKKK